MLWSVVALQSAIRGGALNPILNVDLIVILVAGWLLGLRHALQLAIATVLWLIALPVLQEAGWIHPEPATNPWGILLAQVVILTGGFLAFRLVLSAYQQHVQNAQTLNASLAEKLGDLSRQEAALRESEQRVNQILQASPLPMLVSEFERGTCLEINPAWERSFERARKNVIGRTAVELGMWRDESLRACSNNSLPTRAGWRGLRFATICPVEGCGPCCFRPSVFRTVGSLVCSPFL